jgi:hypothetical protein
VICASRQHHLAQLIDLRSGHQSFSNHFAVHHNALLCTHVCVQYTFLMLTSTATPTRKATCVSRLSIIMITSFKIYLPSTPILIHHANTQLIDGFLLFRQVEEHHLSPGRMICILHLQQIT